MSQELQVDSYLLFLCLCKSQQHNGELPSVEEYMKEEGREVEAACRVAEWLGLVTPDAEGELAWKPTPLFVDQVLQRRKQWNHSTRRKAAESWEEEAFTLIYEAALKEFDDTGLDCEGYVRWFLGYIGLMTITDDGDWIPTKRLLNLAAECRMRERRIHPQHVAPKPTQAYEPEVFVKVREWITPALASPVLEKAHRNG